MNAFVNEENKHLVNEDALDLLGKMLVYDKNKRITAAQALKHTYFNPTREWIKRKRKNEAIN